MKKISFLSIVLCVGMIFAGAFYEYVSCALSIALIGYLFYLYKKNGKLKIHKNISFVAVCSIVLFYGISAFWAVDWGMALIGFFKFMPLILYTLVLMQNEADGKKVLDVMPFAMAIITVITAILMQIEPLKDYFAVAGRLAGTFQYPNTYAIVLLVCELLVVQKEERKIIDYVLIALLLAGILLTGSRTVFVITALSNVVAFLLSKNKKEKTVFIILVLVLVAIMVLYCIITGKTYVFTRYLSISVFESTFVGRILYFLDAIPLVLKNPFGLGYLGYNYIQGTVQTGMYTVMYIHNDFLQLFLDIGWIPSILFICALVKNIIKSKNRLIIIAVVLHTLLDFNLQFVTVFLLLLTLMDFSEGKQNIVKINLPAYCTGSALITCCCLYVGISLALSSLGFVSASYKMNPTNTQNAIYLMYKQTDIDEAYEYAKEILSRNKCERHSYEYAANYAYSKGDISSYIYNKNKAFELNRYAYNTAIEYCNKLIPCLEKYKKAGDNDSYQLCLDQIKQTVRRIQENANTLSRLGKMIKEQPQTTVPDDLLKYV